MRICVFGAGAIGSYMAALLKQTVAEVSVIARGDHLAAIRRDGLRLLTDGRTVHATVHATNDPRELGHQDLVICALKAFQAWESADSFAPLLGPDTAVLTAMNGFPWWYFYKVEGPFEGTSLASVDDGGRQWRKIGPQRAIGCVVEPACEIVEPGVVLHRQYNRFQIGEPDGSDTDRVRSISAVLEASGMRAPVRRDIRNHVWLKLFGNACFNPISLLTKQTIDRILADPSLRALCRTVMSEARRVAQVLGEDVPEEMLERRLNAAASMLGHKMSMLQDIERGRPLELDALVAAVCEVGRLTGVPTPTVDMLLLLLLSLSRARERASWASTSAYTGLVRD